MRIPGLSLASVLLALCGCTPAATFHVLDSTPPFVGVNGPADPEIHGTTTVGATAFDAESQISWIEIRVNGATIYSSPQHGDATVSTTFTPSGPGTYLIEAIATSEGGESTASTSLHFEGF